MSSAVHAEVALEQLSKTGEELCGDKVEVVRTSDATIIVLSDGLGSGVKANILATLTTKIASSMLRRGIALEEVVDTIAETLPVCRQRKIAYSTLHILKIHHDGQTRVIEFDCPQTILIRNNKIIPFPSQEKVIRGKVIKEGQLMLQENDLLVAVSDGIIHAGIGGLLRLGWGWDGLVQELGSLVSPQQAATEVSRQIIRCCEGYYMGKPGDDSTAIAVKIREPRHLTLLIGPPGNRQSDESVVRRFIRQPGKKVVSGGTTANIVSAITRRPLTVDLLYDDPNVPPIGHMEDVDLVTEGVLTLNATLALIGQEPQALKRGDGASLLAKMLLEADYINIYAGTAVNPAHQNIMFPSHINIKKQLIDNLQHQLEARGKQVNIEWY